MTHKSPAVDFNDAVRNGGIHTAIQQVVGSRFDNAVAIVATVISGVAFLNDDGSQVRTTRKSHTTDDVDVGWDGDLFDVGQIQGLISNFRNRAGNGCTFAAQIKLVGIRDDDGIAIVTAIVNGIARVNSKGG